MSSSLGLLLRPSLAERISQQRAGQGRLATGKAKRSEADDEIALLHCGVRLSVRVRPLLKICLRSTQDCNAS